MFRVQQRHQWQLQQQQQWWWEQQWWSGQQWRWGWFSCGWFSFDGKTSVLDLKNIDYVNLKPQQYLSNKATSSSQNCCKIFGPSIKKLLEEPVAIKRPLKTYSHLLISASGQL